MIIYFKYNSYLLIFLFIILIFLFITFILNDNIIIV